MGQFLSQLGPLNQYEVNDVETKTQLSSTWVRWPQFKGYPTIFPLSNYLSYTVNVIDCWLHFYFLFFFFMDGDTFPFEEQIEYRGTKTSWYLN